MRPDAQAHPYPVQIAFQTQEFLQGAVFYAAFTDAATDLLVRQHGGAERVELLMANCGLLPGSFNEAWAILGKYKAVFSEYPFQSALSAMCSHWDWCVRRLLEFIQFGRDASGAAPLSLELQRRLKRADRSPLIEQIEIIQATTGVDLMIAPESVDALGEMTLVRNLATHNRWEVDAFYIEHSKTRGYEKGDIRTVPAHELLHWHQVLVQLIHRSSMAVAKLSCSAPPYSGTQQAAGLYPSES